MMPQSAALAATNEEALDMSSIDIQQAHTIHEAMEQKLSPEEGTTNSLFLSCRMAPKRVCVCAVIDADAACLPTSALQSKLPQLAKRLSDGEHNRNGSDHSLEADTIPPTRSGVKFAEEPEHMQSPAMPTTPAMESRRSLPKSVRMPVPKDVLEAAIEMTGRDNKLEHKSGKEGARNKGSRGR